jgi:hypothetical protein
MKRYLFLIFTGLLISFVSSAQEDKAVSFTQADRDRITRMEVKIDDMNKRFEDIDKRFGDMNKRFGDTNTQITELRQDMRNMMLLFGGLVAAIIGFAIWDRRTMIRPFETKVKEIETNIELKGLRVEKILSSLREIAKTDNKLAEVLRNNNLL